MIICWYFIHPCLSLAQGYCAGSGKRSFPGISIRIFAEWNLLDCVGARHPAVPRCETTNPALGKSCYRGKWCAFLFWLVVVLHYETKFKECLVVANTILWCCLSPLKDYTEKDKKQELHLADILLDYLSVLVEFWCQQHFRLNQKLVENGLKDLAEHFAVISQGME